MALPILQSIRTELPEIQLAYTYFSPSAEKFAASLDVDFRDYLPFDSRSSTYKALEAIRPTAIVFSKLDVWPTLVSQAKSRNIMLGLTSASLPESSSRTKGLSAKLTRHSYALLDRVGASSTGDKLRLIAAGVKPENITVTGDTRYDQAWSRAHQEPQNKDIVTALASNSDSPFTLVAGSTWPSDEEHLLPAWEKFKKIDPYARLIIAPHEILSDHISQLELWAKKCNFKSVTLSNSSSADLATADLVIVNRIGVLADLYKVANVAYVGGGFHNKGLHSLVEPAVFHIPTIIGPLHSSSRDAGIMIAAGGVKSVMDYGSFAATLDDIYQNSHVSETMQRAMTEIVDNELGATERSVSLVKKLLIEQLY